MELVLLGAPGAGKGTQAKLITEAYRLLHLSTGDVLRRNVADGTPLGLEAKKYMDGGQYVPDDLINDLVADQMERPEAKGGVAFDGYPRTLNQAEKLDAMLGKKCRPIDVAINLEVDEEALVVRLAGRRVCGGCGAPYHLKSMPPLRPDVCDACGSPLIQRPDDREETIRTRMEVYRRQTEPLLDYYAKQRKLRTVDASEGIEKTFERVQALLGEAG
ncbi:MAG TPA: adenylate kinase [Armatimonadota bacterium]|jgi:adenylate kinase